MKVLKAASTSSSAPASTSEDASPFASEVAQQQQQENQQDFAAPAPVTAASMEEAPSAQNQVVDLFFGEGIDKLGDGMKVGCLGWLS